MIIQSLLDVLYPTLCPICSRSVDYAAPICDQCLAKLPRTEQHLYRENKVEMLFEQINRPNKQLLRHRFIRGGAWLQYNDDVAHIIHQMKFKEHPEMATFLGQQAAIEWTDSGFFDDIDLLVPVPIHRKRLNARGYNQSEYICRGLASALRLPIDATNLIRIIDTPQQALLSDEQRRANVVNAFTIHEPILFHKKHILLVDDVITTGSTMLHCLKKVIPIRSCQISVFALAAAR